MTKTTNKLVLRVQLYNTSTIKLTLVYIDKKYLTKNKNLQTHYCKTPDNDSFFIYSKDTFYILFNSLRLPDSDNYKSGANITKTFKNNDDRYKYLRNLYLALNHWNIHSTFEYDMNTKRGVRFNGEFWIL